MNGDLEQTAHEIAERGRDELVERLRAAFRDAAASHSAALSLGQPALERMTERAADRADGLQWRRALAAVAAERFGIGLGEALGHPAVVRAHAILGAPSYEEGLARLGPLPLAPAAFAAPEDEEWNEEAEAAELDGSSIQAAELDGSSIRVTGTHLGGIASLASPEPEVELWFSDDGLDIIRASKEPLGRLTWAELRALEVRATRSRFGRRRPPNVYLVVRGEGGDASFEITGTTPEELRLRLAPMLERAGVAEAI